MASKIFLNCYCWNIVQIERIPLGKQVQYFEETRDYLVGTLGENATGKFLRNAVFSIIAGSNDILNYLEPSIPLFEKTKLPPVALQDMMVSNLTLHLKVRTMSGKVPSLRTLTNMLHS